MLKLLKISNLAVIDRLEVEFGGGLNILSGETGSGKSIILDAVELLLGARATPEIIRTGEARAVVEGVFSTTGNEPLLALLDQAGIEIEDDEAIIKREIVTSGRGRIFINNQSATLMLLREIQPHLVDIHGQGEQQSLLAAANHLHLVDSYAGLNETRKKLEAIYQDIAAKLDEIEEYSRSEAYRLQQLDLVRFQCDEIERAKLEEREDERLEAERVRLANAERIKERVSESFALLYEDEDSILTRIGALLRRFNELSAFDERFANAHKELEENKIALEEMSYFLRGYLDDIQVSPEQLLKVEERLAVIDRLKRKYGGTIEAIRETEEGLRRRLQDLENSEERVARLDQELETALNAYEQIARKLSAVRRSRSAEFARKVSRELEEVALEKASFEARLTEPSGSGLGQRMGAGRNRGLRIGRAGEEGIEFYFTANPGEAARELKEVASGGELSRLMLVIKDVTAPTLFPRTLIFDEIDAGIGGRVADTVGAKLQRLARTNQVLCVTHQAQIARYADVHFLVTKQTDGRRTTTSIERLSETDRVEELARMIGGSEVTPLARRHARELLRAR